MIQIQKLPKDVKEAYEEQEKEFFAPYSQHIEYEKEVSKQEGIEEERLRSAENFALELLKDGLPLSKIVQYTKLNEDSIKEIAAQNNPSLN